MTKEKEHVLEIAIWGIALMLIVKALDILHRQLSARSAGQSGAAGMAYGAAAFSVVGAIAIVLLARGQSEMMFKLPNPPARLDDKELKSVLEDADAALSKADEIERQAEAKADELERRADEMSRQLSNGANGDMK